MQKISKGALANFIPPNCAEIKLRAERRAGGILQESERKGLRRPEKTSHDVTLSDLSITKMQSSRWQAVARVLKRKTAPLYLLALRGEGVHSTRDANPHPVTIAIAITNALGDKVLAAERWKRLERY